jgi:hypothetical protein
MMLLIMKLGGLSHFLGNINTDFMFGVDRSPIRFDTSERRSTTDSMYLRLLTAVYQAAHLELHEVLSPYGPTQLIYDRENFDIFQ